MADWHEFLVRICQKYGLTKKEEEIFLLRYEQERSYQEIEKEFHIPQTACLKRMGQVYKKFRVEGDRRGKENTLRIALEQQFQQEQRQLQPHPNRSSADLSPLPIAHPSASFIPSEPVKVLEKKESVNEPSLFAKPTIYQNLPSREYASFIGRQPELRRLLELLSLENSAQLISIGGIGGIGKTTLALEAAYLCLQSSLQAKLPSQIVQTDSPIPTFQAIIFTSAKQKRLTDSKLLERLSPERSLEDICRTIARTLKVEIQLSTDNQMEFVKALLDDRFNQQPILLIVDNLETLENQEKVLAFLCDLPPSVKVVLTTRGPALFQPIHLGVLPKDEGLKLIEQEAARKNGVIAKHEAEQIYHLTSGVPIAMVYAVARHLTYHEPLPLVRQHITNSTGDIAHFFFASSVELLREQVAYQLLMALALFVKPVLKETIASTAFKSADSMQMEIEKGLAVLQQLSLVNQQVHQQEQRYSMLPLTREYALAELAKSPLLEREMRNRWVEWYHSFSEKYRELDWKEWQLAEKCRALEAEWENLQSVIEWCIEQDRYDDVLYLWGKVRGYAHVQGDWSDRLRWTQWLMEAAEAQQDYQSLVEIWYARAWTLTLIGQSQYFQEVHYLLQRAWESSHRHKNISLQMNLVINWIVLCLRGTQKLEEAKRWIREGRNLLKQRGWNGTEREQQRIHLSYYQAELAFYQKEYAKARRQYEQAWKQANQIGWRRMAVSIQNWMAEVAIRQKDFDAAKQLLDQSLREAKDHQDIRTIAFLLRTYARLSHLLGNQKETQHYAEQAAMYFERLRMNSEAEEVLTLPQRSHPC